MLRIVLASSVFVVTLPLSQRPMTTEAPLITTTEAPPATTTAAPDGRRRRQTPATTTEAPPATTTEVPRRPTTTEAPLITTTEAPPATTTEAPPATTTEVPPATTTEAPPATTTEAPLATTTEAPPATTTKTVPCLPKCELCTDLCSAGHSIDRACVVSCLKNMDSVESTLTKYCNKCIWDGDEAALLQKISPECRNGQCDAGKDETMMLQRAMGKSLEGQGKSGKGGGICYATGACPKVCHSLGAFSGFYDKCVGYCNKAWPQVKRAMEEFCERGVCSESNDKMWNDYKSMSWN